MVRDSHQTSGRNWHSGWDPHVETFQFKSVFVVRANLPGRFNLGDVRIEATEGELAIHAERYEEHDELDAHGSPFGSYSSFCRVIPLPAGAIAASAKANFNGTVLEVTIESPQM